MGEHQQQRRRRDHADHHGPHAFHGSFDERILLEPQEEARDEQHQRQRGQAYGECRQRRPQNAAPLVSGLCADGIADVGRGVDGDGAGRDLRDGHDVGEFGVGHPCVLYDHFVLDQGEHGVSAAEAEEPYFEVACEELPEDHFFAFLVMSSVHEMPIAAAAIRM